MGIGGQSRISSIINHAYGQKYKLKSPGLIGPSQNAKYGLSLRSLGSLVPFKKKRSASRKSIIFLSVSAILVLKIIMGVYYYNMLVDTEQNMLASHGDVQALIQRRNDIATNLSKAVFDYSNYEQGVFKDVVSLRKFFTESNLNGADTLKQLENYYKKTAAGAPSPRAEMPEMGSIASALSKLVAVSEQYPDLKLSTNFETLMGALVQIEMDLASQRVKFNQETNIYTTVMAKFPGNVFAWVFDFKTRKYFDADEQAKSFRIIGY